MMTIALVLVSVAAFAALALGMERHAKDVLGRAPSAARRAVLRATGWVLLALALAIGVAGWGHTVGVVEWVAALTAATVPLVLLVLPRFAGRGGATTQRKPAPAEALDTPAPRSMPGKAWRCLRFAGLIALPLFMVWAFTQVPPSAL